MPLVVGAALSIGTNPALADSAWTRSMPAASVLQPAHQVAVEAQITSLEDSAWT
ncbi:hypothetical protein OG871_19365 [Kitasatospora sp. NBC_00374]|uniref:hypothetical protein n=1 Tax=Kitasatospora sp. NBC_00374 TaxID=2975964 RepID=UPI0030E5F0B5